MVNKKQYKFSVLVDEFGKNKKYLKKLAILLAEEYPFLKQANRYVTNKRLVAAKKGDVIIFGLSRKYDFKVVPNEDWEDLIDGRRFKLVELDGEWSKVKTYLDRYAEANYPDEYEDEQQQECYCCAYDVDLYDFNTIRVVSSPKKKGDKEYIKFLNKHTRASIKRSSKLQLEEVTVHHNFVKVGWDVYDIWLDKDEEEYVTINKNVYWIDRDSAGNGKLSVK